MVSTKAARPGGRGETSSNKSIEEMIRQVREVCPQSSEDHIVLALEEVDYDAALAIVALTDRDSAESTFETVGAKKTKKKETHSNEGRRGNDRSGTDRRQARSDQQRSSRQTQQQNNHQGTSTGGLATAADVISSSTRTAAAPLAATGVAGVATATNGSGWGKQVGSGPKAGWGTHSNDVDAVASNLTAATATGSVPWGNKGAWNTAKSTPAPQQHQQQQRSSKTTSAPQKQKPASMVTTTEMKVPSSSVVSSASTNTVQSWAQLAKGPEPKPVIPPTEIKPTIIDDVPATAAREKGSRGGRNAKKQDRYANKPVPGETATTTPMLADPVAVTTIRTQPAVSLPTVASSAWNQQPANALAQKAAVAATAASTNVTSTATSNWGTTGAATGWKETLDSVPVATVTEDVSENGAWATDPSKKSAAPKVKAQRAPKAPVDAATAAKKPSRAKQTKPVVMPQEIQTTNQRSPLDMQFGALGFGLSGATVVETNNASVDATSAVPIVATEEEQQQHQQSSTTVAQATTEQCQPPEAQITQQHQPQQLQHQQQQYQQQQQEVSGPTALAAANSGGSQLYQSQPYGGGTNFLMPQHGFNVGLAYPYGEQGFATYGPPDLSQQNVGPFQYSQNGNAVPSVTGARSQQQTGSTNMPSAAGTQPLQQQGYMSSYNNKFGQQQQQQQQQMLQQQQQQQPQANFDSSTGSSGTATTGGAAAAAALNQPQLQQQPFQMPTHSIPNFYYGYPYLSPPFAGYNNTNFPPQTFTQQGKVFQQQPPMYAGNVKGNSHPQHQSNYYANQQRGGQPQSMYSGYEENPDAYKAGNNSTYATQFSLLQQGGNSSTGKVAGYNSGSQDGNGKKNAAASTLSGNANKQGGSGTASSGYNNQGASLMGGAGPTGFLNQPSFPMQGGTYQPPRQQWS